MKKDELMKLVGKRVKVTFILGCGGVEITGILGYTKEFSASYGWRRPHYFTLDTNERDYDFLVSHVKKVEVIEE
jgi:hypothetical protein